MENHSIIRQFQNLRVFSNSRYVSMDELVQDLANALDESASPVKGTSHSLASKRHYKRRKGKKRRTFILDCGNISEASESSIDEALKDYFENVTQQSDSDDLGRITRLSMPVNANFIPSVESDSVNESNISPIRPQRRRKKYKTMAVDSDPELSIMQPPETVDRAIRSPKSRISALYRDDDISSDKNDAMSGKEEEVLPGKRKRNAKSRGEYSGAYGGSRRQKDGNEKMETTVESSSSLSSSESDGLLTNDEAREADDEQSDFYYEPGPACGIPGIIKWWENDAHDLESESDKQIHQILAGSFEHMPKSSQLAFRARVTRMMAKTGRQIRFGRRKLKEKVPGYTVSKFLKERQMWNDMQGTVPSGFPSSNGSMGDQKRFRKTPPPTTLIDEVSAGGKAIPIPENNIGNRMLQDIGWSPGNGIEGAGIKVPVLPYRRPKRQGLGCSTHPYIRHTDT